MMMQVILSVPNPSLCCKFVGQFVSNIISTTVASPLNLLLSIDYSILLSARILAFFLSGEPPGFKPGLLFEPVEFKLDCLPTFIGLIPAFGVY